MRLPSGPARAITNKSAVVFRITESVPSATKLEENVAAGAIHKLRDKGEKKQSGLGVENFRGHALPERIPRGCADVGGNVSIGDVVSARVDHHTNAQEAEIGCAGVLDRGEGCGGFRENDGDAESGCEDMHHAAQEGAEGGENAFALSAGQAAGQDVEHSGAGRDGEQ